jgi:hypothetical protein
MDILDDEKSIIEAENWADQSIFNEIEEETYNRGSFTVCIIHAIADNHQFEGVGFSRARQETSPAKFDVEIGKKISRGRAIHDLMKDYAKNKK